MFSMTAFARVSGVQGNITWVWELRSVNNRFLDVQCRVPESVKSCEPACRDLIRQVLNRGKVDAILRLETETPEHQLELNTPKLFHLQTLLEEIKNVFPQTAPIDPIALLSMPNMLHERNLEEEVLDEAQILFALEQAVEAFVAERAREGEALKTVLQQRVDASINLITGLQSQLERLMSAHIDNIKQKVLLIAPDLEESRWAQEVALLAQRADICEEIDRLQVHFQDLQTLLQTTEPVGRKLDFLMQELNREANTLGSKSTSIEITQTSLSLKLLIEQMREQIQNIE